MTLQRSRVAPFPSEAPGRVDPRPIGKRPQEVAPPIERPLQARQGLPFVDQRLGGAAKMQPLGHGHEIPKLP